jgi:hypothetical protein
VPVVEGSDDLRTLAETYLKEAGYLTASANDKGSALNGAYLG